MAAIGGSSFPNGFTNGLMVRGLPLHTVHPGEGWYGNNSSVVAKGGIAGSNINDGTYRKPFSTLTYALSRALESRGDIIILMPGHAETITAAAGIAVNKAGVAIVGLGVGSLRPTITYTTANTATMTVAANNVTIMNVLFVGGFLNVATAINIVNAQIATDLTVDNCEFRDSSAILNFVSAVTFGTTANISDGFTFSNNKVIAKASAPAAATTAIVTASDAVRWDIRDNFCSHQVLLAATAVLIGAGALNIANSLIQKNRVVRPNTDASNPLMISNTGTSWLGTMISDNYAGQLSGATGLLMNVSSKASFVNNYAMVTGAADKSALINPVAV